MRHLALSQGLHALLLGSCLAGRSVVSADSILGQKYKYLTYGGLVDKLKETQDLAPGFVSVKSAQKKYGLPAFGDCGKGTPCEVWFARVTHEASLRQPDERPEVSTCQQRPFKLATRPSLTRRPAGLAPQVFFSGALHGNERVGPTTTVGLARLLAAVGACVDRASPQSVADGSLCQGILGCAQPRAWRGEGLLSKLWHPPAGCPCPARL